MNGKRKSIKINRGLRPPQLMEIKMIKNTMMSLYEKNPAAWDNIIIAGNKHIGQLSKKMTRAVDLDLALGVTNSAGKWHRGLFSPTTVMEARARDYINNGYQRPADQEPELPTADPEPLTRGEDEVLVVIVPDASKIGKVTAVLKALGCIVT